MAIQIEMTEEEIQEDARKAATLHEFHELKEISKFIQDVNNVIRRKDDK